MTAETNREVYRVADLVIDVGAVSVKRGEEQLAVPDIARRYRVSRQHVQVTVNRLAERSLLESTENPRHKRSPLVHLTSLGRNTFAAIRESERAILDELFAGVEIADLATTKRTLERLLARLTEGDPT